MSDAEYVQKIRGWLERSGYDLELRVARAARRGGAAVLQSVSYDDPEEGKRRETDVVATYLLDTPERSDPVSITLVVECKRGTGQTWIAFTDDQARLSRDPLVDHAIATTTSIAPQWFREVGRRWKGRPPFDAETPLARSIVAADLGGVKRENGVNLAGDAAKQSLSAATALRYFNHDSRVTLPLVVTGGSLFTSKLDEEDEIDLQEVDYVRVRVSPPSTDEALLVHVMTLARFERFAVELFEVIEDIERLGPVR